MLTTLMHASVNVVCQGKSGPGKIPEVILVTNWETQRKTEVIQCFLDVF